MNTQTYTVNIRTGVVNITRVDVSQGDTGRTLAFKLYDGLIPFTPPTGSTVTIVGRKPSGLGFSETCTVSGNTAAVNTTLAMTQESGKIPVELRIEADGQSIGTANFTMYIEPSPHPAGTTDGTTEEARTVLAQCEEYAQIAQDAAEAASGDYTQLSAEIGTLSELTTTAKSSAVAAINEVNNGLSDVKAYLEDLDDRVEALESDSGGSGLSSTQKQTLMNVINALGGAFTTPSAQSLVDAFNSAWNVAVTGISLNKSTLSFSALTSETLIATLSPSDATGTVTWVSSNTSVATVDSNGTVAVVGNGTATITASCGGYSATCAVTVSGIATTYTVTYNLTGCESSNPQTRAEEGSTFTASITPVVGYLLPFTAYTVTMGGTDITASAWSSGTVSVAEVTGDIVISATATVDSRTLLYAWDLTQSLIDTVNNTEATLINTVTAENLPTRDSNGLHFTEAGQVAQFVTLDEIASKVIEMDVASMDFKGNTLKHIRFLNNNYGNTAHSLLIRKSSNTWTAYENGWQTPTAVSGQTIPSDPNAFSGHTVSCEISSSRSMTVYVDGTPTYTVPEVYNFGRSITIGGAPTGTQNDGQQIFDCTITGLRIYSI